MQHQGPAEREAHQMNPNELKTAAKFGSTPSPPISNFTLFKLLTV
jgi:hypothetical protein